MEQTYTIQQKLIQFMKILLPILVTQIVLQAMSFFDTTMSGHAGTADLAGVAIGANIWLPLQTGLNGLLLAVTPIVAQLLGAKKEEEIPNTVMQALYLALIISILVVGLAAVTLKPLLSKMGLEGSVETIAFYYLAALGLGVFPYFAYTVLRSFIDSLGKTKVTMIITLISLPTNAFLNYAFIFGKFGFPRLGGVGSGVATSLTYWIILGITVLVMFKIAPFKNYKVLNKLCPVSKSKQLEIIKIGLPMGLAIGAETAVFSAVTILMSAFNTATIAAHQAAMNFETLLFMAPLSISMALTILIGFEVGAKRFEDAKKYQQIGLRTSLSFAVLCGISLLLVRKHVALAYSNDSQVIMLIQQFLIYAVFFQLSDAYATPTHGILRGYKDVTVPSLVSFTAHWVIGLPIGFILATRTDLGAFGYWIGFIAGISAAAIVLTGRLAWLNKKSPVKNI
jgi:MATE family multidrug resistance protein